MEQQYQAPKMSSTNPKDIEENKVIAAIGYLGILCVLPLFMKKESPFAQFHGKQGLVLFVVWIALSFINIIPFLGQLIWVLGSLVLLVVMIIGIMNALQGKMWEMPILGDLAKKINF